MADDSRIRTRVYGHVNFSDQAQRPAFFDEPASAWFRLRNGTEGYEDADLPLSYEMRADSQTFLAFWLGATLSGSTVVHNIRTDFAMNVQVTGGRLTDVHRVTATVSSPWTEVVFQGGGNEVRVEIPAVVRKALLVEFFGPSVPIETL
jgi:hypothetical protein